jgi:hypothetical protein
MIHPMSHVHTALRALTGAALVAALSVMASSQTLPIGLRSDAPQPLQLCGTRVDEGLRGLRPRAVDVVDGETLSFEQDPPLLFPHYAGVITLRQFSVVGDIPTLEFHRWNPDKPEGDLEVWSRSRSQAINGRVVSVFEPSWDSRVLDGVLSRVRVGYDRPSVFWGYVVVNGVNRSVILRVGFGLSVSDTHGMKLMRRDAVEPLARQCRTGADLFDKPETLRKLWPKLVRSCAIDSFEASKENYKSATAQEIASWIGRGACGSRAQKSMSWLRRSSAVR